MTNPPVLYPASFYTAVDDLRNAKVARAKAEARVLEIESRLQAEAEAQRSRLEGDPAVSEFATALGAMIGRRTGGMIASTDALLERAVDILVLARASGVVL